VGTIDSSTQGVIESDIDVFQLVDLMNDIETNEGIGRLIHSEAMSGISYLKQVVRFNSYLIFTEDNGSIQCYKYNFDENLIPLNISIPREKRNNRIDRILYSK